MPFIGYTAHYIMSHIRIDLRVMALIMSANVCGLAIEVANDLISLYHSVTKCCLTQNCIWHRGMLEKICTYWHSSICWIFTDWKVNVSSVRQWVMHFSSSNSDVCHWHSGHSCTATNPWKTLLSIAHKRIWGIMFRVLCMDHFKFLLTDSKWISFIWYLCLYFWDEIL